MSVYDKPVEPSIYPTLPTAPEDESQIYRLKHIEEVENFLIAEVKEREKLYKKFKRYLTMIRQADHASITVGAITSTTGIVVFATGIGVPIACALEGVSLAFIALQVGLRKNETKLRHKVEKHDKIRVLAEIKLEVVNHLVSKAIDNNHISMEEFRQIVQEKQYYLLRKHELRVSTKKALEQINDTQRDELIALGRKKEREDFSKNFKSVMSANNT